jgi:hypothetical protein
MDILAERTCVTGLGNVAGDLPANLPNIAMGITFSVYHLIYAFCAWPRKRAGEIEQFALE